MRSKIQALSKMKLLNLVNQPKDDLDANSKFVYQKVLIQSEMNAR